MFEKDAKECFKKRYPKNIAINSYYVEGFDDGYNKANEWHYVKDGDFPEEGETVYCFCRGYCGVSFCATARLYIGYDDKVRRWWTNAGAGKSEQLMDVIAWKEIVPPEVK